MRKVNVFVDGVLAGELLEVKPRKKYRFVYLEGYRGASVSLTMPINQPIYDFDRFPPFFEGLLPEGIMLEMLLKQKKIDRADLLAQLISIGDDLVGNVTVEAKS